MQKYEIQKEKAKDYVFVGGKTKYLEHLTDDEAQILLQNGDKRVTLKKSEEQPALNE